MIRDVRPTTHLLRWQYGLLISCLTLFLLCIETESTFAQTAVNPSSDGTILARLAQDDDAPILSEHGMDSPNHEAVRRPLRLSGRPPLPFRAPQIGPLIRRVSMDNIEHRTTAFIPQSLEQLTAIDLPDEEKWIRVDLSEQIVVAYEHDQPIRAFIVSSGLPGTPTVTGQFRIRMKVNEQTMAGGTGSMFYNLPGVKWVQYFYKDYGFHGTYWHSNFGHPMSHGCINMTDADAKWLFDWAGPVWDGETDWYPSTSDNPGTLVVVTK